jgi:D-arabinose 1-dehydrogenase-like Zn-dependent alcohol dehydrogenase
MSQTVKGVIARGKGLPVELVDINVPKPGPSEARVRVQACGVCHTDLHYREGGINDDFPFLLGHEAAGVVESMCPSRDLAKHECGCKRAVCATPIFTIAKAESTTISRSC